MITFDSATGTNMVNSSISLVQDFPHTIGVGSDKFLQVWFHYASSTANTAISGVTYNGVAMNRFFRTNIVDGTTWEVEIFQLANPDSGAHDVEVTLLGIPTLVFGQIFTSSFFGVEQTHPFDISATQTLSGGTIANATTTLTSSSDVNMTSNTTDAWLTTLYWLFTGTAGVSYVQNDGTLRTGTVSNAFIIDSVLVTKGPLGAPGLYTDTADNDGTPDIGTGFPAMRSWTTLLRPSVVPPTFIPQMTIM